MVPLSLAATGLFGTLGRSGWLDAHYRGNEIAKKLTASEDADHRIIAHSQGVRNVLEGIYRYAKQNPCARGVIRLVLMAPKVPQGFVDDTVSKIKTISPKLHIQVLVVYDNGDFVIPHSGATPWPGNFSSRIFGRRLETGDEIPVNTKTLSGHESDPLAGNILKPNASEQDAHIKFRINSFLGNGFTTKSAP